MFRRRETCRRKPRETCRRKPREPVTRIYREQLDQMNEILRVCIYILKETPVKERTPYMEMLADRMEDLRTFCIEHEWVN